MQDVSRRTAQKTWRGRRAAVSVLAEMALRQEKVAERLAMLRERHALTQEQAAAKVGVTLRQWQRWEAGQSMPYPRNLELIASRFGFSVADFFDDQQLEANGQGAEILSLLRSTDERLRRIEELLARRELEDVADQLEDEPPATAAG